MLPVVLTTVLGAAFVRIACGASLQATVGSLLQYYEALWIILVNGVSYQQLRRHFGAPSIPSSSRRVLWEETEPSESDSTLTDESTSQDEAATELSSRQERSLASAMWMHSLALHLESLNRPLYAGGDLRETLQNTLKESAVAGTPVDWLCSTRRTTVFYLVCIHPTVVFFSALSTLVAGNCDRRRDVGDVFEEKLLSPMRWFAHWSLRSQLLAPLEFSSGSLKACGKMSRSTSECSEGDVSTTASVSLPAEASDDSDAAAE